MIDFVECYYYNTPFTPEETISGNQAVRMAFEKLILRIVGTKLTPKQKVVFLKKYEQGKRQIEIAKELNLTQPTISRIILSAKENVNEYLSFCYYAIMISHSQYIW